MYNIVPRPAQSFVNEVPITLHKNHPNSRSRRKKERARVSPSRTPVLSYVHYFQAPATQATTTRIKTSCINIQL